MQFEAPQNFASSFCNQAAIASPGLRSIPGAVCSLGIVRQGKVWASSSKIEARGPSVPGRATPALFKLSCKLSWYSLGVKI